MSETGRKNVCEGEKYRRVITTLEICGLKKYQGKFEEEKMDDACIQNCIDNLQELDFYLNLIIPIIGERVNFVIEFRKTKGIEAAKEGPSQPQEKKDSKSLASTVNDVGKIRARLVADCPRPPSVSVNQLAQSINLEPESVQNSAVAMVTASASGAGSTWMALLDKLLKEEKTGLETTCLQIVTYLTFIHAHNSFPVEKEIAFSGWKIPMSEIEESLNLLQNKYKLIKIQGEDLLHLDIEIDCASDCSNVGPWFWTLTHLNLKQSSPQFQPLLTEMINYCIHILTELELSQAEKMFPNFMNIAKKSKSGHKIMSVIPRLGDFLFQLARRMLEAKRNDEAYPLFTQASQIFEKEYEPNNL